MAINMAQVVGLDVTRVFLFFLGSDPGGGLGVATTTPGPVPGSQQGLYPSGGVPGPAHSAENLTAGPPFVTVPIGQPPGAVAGASAERPEPARILQTFTSVCTNTGFHVRLLALDMCSARALNGKRLECAPLS